MTQSPIFDDYFCDRLEDLILWRRDVRRFQNRPVDPGLIEHLLGVACLAPSVGNSQPWRYVVVTDPARRIAVRRNFITCNSEALHDYQGERAKLYATLKLSGLDDAPVQIGVFCDHATAAGFGLGQKTMPETLDYSVVASIQILWLTARAHGLGLGWVSIVDPALVKAALDVPEEWSLIAYLCIGYPQEEHTDPELIRHHWQDREALDKLILRR